MSQIESQGLPGVMIASSAFEEAFETQSNALGFHPAAVFVAHPIQNRTDKEIQDMADQAAEQIIQAIFDDVVRT